MTGLVVIIFIISYLVLFVLLGEIIFNYSDKQIKPSLVMLALSVNFGAACYIGYEVYKSGPPRSIHPTMQLPRIRMSLPHLKPITDITKNLTSDDAAAVISGVMEVISNVIPNVDMSSLLE